MLSNSNSSKFIQILNNFNINININNSNENNNGAAGTQSNQESAENFSGQQDMGNMKQPDPTMAAQNNFVN